MNTTYPCPQCSASLPAGAPQCQTCGIYLTGPAAAQLWHIDQQIAQLNTERARLLQLLKNPQQYTTGRQMPAVKQSMSGQQVFLGLGALLLLSAVSVFAFVAWALVGVEGQAIILTATTIGAATGARFAAKKNLIAAAHTGSVISVGVSALMCLGAWALDFAEVQQLDATLYIALSCVCLAGLWTTYHFACDKVWPRTSPGTIWPACTAGVLGVSAISLLAWLEPNQLGAGAGLLGVSALCFAGWWTARHIYKNWQRNGATTWLLGAAGSLSLGMMVLCLTGFNTQNSLLDRYSSAALLTAVAVVVAFGSKLPWVKKSTTKDLYLKNTAGAIGLLPIGIVAITWSWPSWAIATGICIALIAAGHSIKTGNFTTVFRTYTTGIGATGLLALWTLDSANIDTLAEIANSTYIQNTTAPFGLQLALWAGYTAACCWASVRDKTKLAYLPLAGASAWLTVLFVDYHTPDITSVVAGTLLVFAALMTARFVGATKTTWNSGVAAVSLFVSCHSILVIAHTFTTGWDSWVKATTCWVLAACFTIYASADGKLKAGYITAGFVTLGNATLVYGLDSQAAVEWVTLPAAAVLAGLGYTQTRIGSVSGHRQQQNKIPTTIAWGPALSVALLPSLAVGLSEDNILRLSVVLLAGIVCLLVGFAKEALAPVLVGTIVVTAISITQGGPYLAYVPSWVTLAAGGAVLLTAGVAWEKALESGKKVGRWLEELH